jgi:hypothetical protein
MKTDTKRLWHERQKSIRMAIRLKYSLMADHEINTVLELEKKKFWECVHKGRKPAQVPIFNV